MVHKKRLLKTMSCALTLTIACSCGAADGKTEETEPEKESFFESISEIEESAIPFENMETTAPFAEENPEYLIGADGNPVPTAKGRKDEDSDKWRFDDFTFYREATGLTFYDDSYMEMEDSWKVLRVGDVFGSLTVAQATCEYHELALQYENAKINRLPDHDAIWNFRNVTFDGTVTLSGRLFADMREGAFGGGVLLFQPDAMSLKDAGFPMLKSVHFSWARDSVYAKDIYPIEDSDVFILGDAVEYDDIFDYASFIDENESISVYAEVQLTDIKVNYGTPTGSYPCGDSRAKLLSVKMIDLPVSSDSEQPDPTEPQDDFSDIVELTYEQIMERFDQIAERAFHTEIKNDMEMEEIISCLMDRYIICTNTYVLSSLFDLATDENGFRITITDQDQNIYHKIQFRYFNTLAEMENFTKNTFTQSRAELYISNSSSMDVYIPKFIENEDGIYYCTPSYVISPSPSFYDDYIVEIKEQSETECVFSYNANVDPKRYNQMLEANGEMVWAESDFYHEGRIVLENGEWRIDSISPAAF